MASASGHGAIPIRDPQPCGQCPRRDAGRRPPRHSTPPGELPAAIAAITQLNSLNAMGYETLVSRSGNEALETVRSTEKIDLLFTEVIIPGGLNGVELAQEARRLRPDLPVLLTTGFVAVGADAPAVVDETSRMLRKPYRQPELARMVRDVLRS
jgi:CheY-like chemotaxis protein